MATAAAGIGLIAALAHPAFAVAQEADAGPATTAGGWTFKLTPYAWLAGLDGKVRTRSRLPAADVDASFSDIFDDTNFALMMLGEARRDRFGVILDVDYLDISSEGSTPGDLFSGVKASSNVLIGTLGLAYRVLDRPKGLIDVVGGARLWSIDNELKLEAGRLNEVSTSRDQTWVDPIIGLRGGVDLSDDIYVSAYTDIGGFGAGSKFTWQVLASVGYRFNDHLTAEVGYRYLSVDYDHDGFLWDVDLYGPVIGISYRF
ncbi:porin family protein [Geminicoccus flavidas]|uniref:hypothetical protein n=1 Tax=Geminicoccus flavidas TaxID=2506407 RepID=UPI0013578C1F|nr:hypothetical protein [Geminicoccus flavidas]